MPLLWFSPNPRFVLDLAQVHVSTSLRKTIRARPYEVRLDTRFVDVMRGCQNTQRPGQDGTWITDELIEGYEALHRQGLAHSIEAYDDGELVGGLYGVSLGRAFFGESMFALRPDASKIAAITMFGNLRAWGFHFVDCQVYTDHLSRFGAEQVPRSVFLQSLRRALSEPTRKGPWHVELDPTAALDCLRQGPQAA
jgi:leucyl/phenylalanyl-tRNA--protein transferase